MEVQNINKYDMVLGSLPPSLITISAIYTINQIAANSGCPARVSCHFSRLAAWNTMLCYIV